MLEACPWLTDRTVFAEMYIVVNHTIMIDMLSSPFIRFNFHSIEMFYSATEETGREFLREAILRKP